MFHAAAAVQLSQRNTVLPHNCDRNFCIEIDKMMSQILPLFLMRSVNTEEFFPEIFNIKRDFDCRREMLLYLHT
jgi:hypothetical protein